MMRSSPVDTELNDFLFAPIGEERNEMVLSVLSALARLGIDPWQEAAQLALQPKELAAQRLASIIGNLPVGRWAPSDSRIIADRLVQLLPSRNDLKAVPVAANAGVPQIICCLAMMLLIYAIMWGALSMSENLRQRSEITPTGMAHTSAGPAPQAPLLGSD